MSMGSPVYNVFEYSSHDGRSNECKIQIHKFITFSVLYKPSIGLIHAHIIRHKMLSKHCLRMSISLKSVFEECHLLEDNCLATQPSCMRANSQSTVYVSAMTFPSRVFVWWYSAFKPINIQMRKPNIPIIKTLA